MGHPHISLTSEPAKKETPSLSGWRFSFGTSLCLCVSVVNSYRTLPVSSGVGCSFCAGAFTMRMP